MGSQSETGVTKNLASYLENPNVRAALDTIAWAEGADYNTNFGGKSFDTSKGWSHPRNRVGWSGGASDAAGRYQFLSTTWDEVAKKVGANDFSPRNQDLAALALIQRRGVSLDDLAANGLNPQVLNRLAPEWASLPTLEGKSYYGQPVKKTQDLLNRFSQSRDTYAKGAPPQGATFPGPAAGGVPLVAQQVAGAGVEQIFGNIFGAQPAKAGGPGLSEPVREAAIASIMQAAAPAAAAAATAAAGGGLAYLAGQALGKRRFANEQAVQLTQHAMGKPMSGLTPLTPAVAQQPIPTAQTSETSQFSVPAQQSGPLERVRSVSTSFDTGQPGIDLYWEDKGFRALLPGVVKDIGYQGSGRGAKGKGYGKYVVVESVDPATGKKVDVLKAHLDDINVKVGQQVNEGDIIGRQGGTGRVLSQDGTIASIDFLAPAPAGSGSMKPYENFDSLRRRIARVWSK
jgi:muramidase (phage lysozyme)